MDPSFGDRQVDDIIVDTNEQEQVSGIVSNTIEDLKNSKLHP